MMRMYHKSWSLHDKAALSSSPADIQHVSYLVDQTCRGELCLETLNTYNMLKTALMVIKPQARLIVHAPNVNHYV